MKLNDLPRKGENVSKRGAVSSLPDVLLKQVIDAVANDTHSTKAIAEWLQGEGYPNVSGAAVEYWIRSGDGAPKRGSGLGSS